jgi:hypothetical protein
VALRSRPPNKGMKLPRVGAGAWRSRRSGAVCWIAAQLMPGVVPTVRGQHALANPGVGRAGEASQA